ncbi:hypothetical protein [Nocardiopsis ganjiahuensis]|uniref:hypothetical protein n=1 Tax=Nocardiopsis ganjiahuensis TaxID=239984 RepID=UPI0003492FD2|nr:hypothetical protein [Nocardiopsis ganjiahuensis]
MTTTTTTARAITLPLGTTPDGQPLSWHLTDEDGRPQHGLIVGQTGSGGSTVLARLATSARAAGVRSAIIALDHPLDPVWDQAPWNAARCTDAGDLVHDLDGLLGQVDPDPAVGLVLVDGARALRAAPGQWVSLIRRATQLGISIVARVYHPGLAEFGDDVLRCHLAVHGQYLALGRVRGTTAAVAADLLPGYTPPERDQLPGQGVYGHAGTTTAVTVTA